ncbi:MAG: DUF6776 family protein [Porticoccaceae bacterium]
MMSRSFRDRNRPQIPWQRWLWTLLALAVCAVAAAIGGYRIGANDGREDAVSSHELLGRLEAAQTKGTYLEQQLTNRLLAAEIDWKSIEQVRQMIAELEEQLSLQKEELDLYRLLLNRDSNVKGVHIEHWKVVPADVTGFYDYQLVIRQNVDLKTTFSADLEVVVFGEKEGRAIGYPLSGLDSEVNEESIRLSFRYFKFLRGRLQLPSGFEPKEIEVVVQRTGSSKYKEKKTFEWNSEG